jgi:predicted GTPase
LHLTKSYSIATGARNEVRMILLGKTGAGENRLKLFKLFDLLYIQGKSSFGNTIVGEKKFASQCSPCSITATCSSNGREFDGKKLFVVDTPGFFDTSESEEVIYKEIARSYAMTAFPGPHAFLLVVSVSSRFVSSDFEIVNSIQKIFGPKVINHTIIIFTHRDYLDGNDTTIEKYLEHLKENSPLKKVLDECRQRYLAVNNHATNSEKTATVRTLLDMIGDIVAVNNGQVHTTANLEVAAKATLMSKK